MAVFLVAPSLKILRGRSQNCAERFRSVWRVLLARKRMHEYQYVVSDVPFIQLYDVNSVINNSRHKKRHCKVCIVDNLTSHESLSGYRPLLKERRPRAVTPLAYD